MIYTSGWKRSTDRVKCFALEQNTVSPARVQTLTTRSADERTNHEARASDVVKN